MSALLCSSAFCQASAPFMLQELGHGAWAAIDNPAAKADGAGSNSGFVIGSESVLVVDTFENPAAAKKMLEAIRENTKLPVRYVVNTHYHLDHVAGNAIFAEGYSRTNASRVSIHCLVDASIRLGSVWFQNRSPQKTTFASAS